MHPGLLIRRVGAAVALLSALAGCLRQHASENADIGLEDVVPVSRVPTSDVDHSQVFGVGDERTLFLNVDDGTAAGASDFDETSVQSVPGAGSAWHTTGYSGAPAGRTRVVTVQYVATRGTGEGTSQAFLYDGETLLGAGAVNALGDWAMYSDLFEDLDVADANRLRVRLQLTNEAGKGSLMYSQIWLSVYATTPQGSSVAPPSSVTDAPAGSEPDVWPARDPTTLETSNDGGTTASAQDAGASPISQGTPAVLLAAGDIATCNGTGDDRVANLLDGLPGTVAALGDVVYDSGTASEFERCYGPTWGRHRARTRPAVGNHEYLTTGAAPYFAYFGSSAGEPSKGYYSYELGDWHVVVLNSNCSKVGGCGAWSPQETWLRADLAAHPRRCTLAYLHHPRFSSGQWGNQTSMQPLWQALYELGADVVLAGHDHHYERFAPLNAQGQPDDARGIRPFVVGTGGKNYSPYVGPPTAHSEVIHWKIFGVLQLTLHPDRYDWRFLPEAGQTFQDSGSSVCH